MFVRLLNPIPKSKMATSITLQEARKQFINSDKQWYPKEEEDLKIEYTINEFDLLTICNIHKRMPVVIINKLKKLGLIPAKNEVRGWNLFSTTELYKSLAKNKVKRKKQKKPKVVENIPEPTTAPPIATITTTTEATVYSYPINYGYDKIVEDMNQKEEELRNEIRFHMENREQIIRIRQLENELAYIKHNIANEGQGYYYYYYGQ